NDAQRIIKIDDTYSYNEGFYSAKHLYDFDSLRRHAFNSLNDLITDFSSAVNSTMFEPCFYYGIHIPNNMVEHLLRIFYKGDNKINATSDMLSLTIPYFLVATDRKEWLEAHRIYFLYIPKEY